MCGFVAGADGAAIGAAFDATAGTGGTKYAFVSQITATQSTTPARMAPARYASARLSRLRGVVGLKRP